MTGTGRSATAPSRTPFLLSPRVFFAVMAGTLVAGLVVRAMDGGALAPAAEALLAAYLAWLLAEVPVTFRRAAAAPAGWTLVPYASARTAVIAGGALGPLPWTAWSPWLIVPAAVFVTGVTVRYTAIRTLGRFYSHHVMRQDDHRIVTSGLYRLVRHPAYVGMLLANIGFTAFFLNVFSGVALLALGAAVIGRIREEERVLWQIPEYPVYATGKPRLLPGVW